jgi:hypothetical protein
MENIIKLHLTDEEKEIFPDYEEEAEKVISTENVLESTENSVEIISLPITNSSPEISATEGKNANETNRNLARQYLEMKMAGVEENVILRTLGVPKKAISPAELNLEIVKKTLNENFLKDELRRVLVKNTRNKVLYESLLENNLELALKAAKEIAGEPEIGLNAPPITQVNISLEKVQQALEKADVVEFDFEE